MRIVYGILAIPLSTLLVARAGVVDRVAVVVGTQVITQTQVDEEVRVTEFENQEPLKIGSEERRAAGERLVDQQLLRSEMQLENYQAPPASEAAKLLEEFRRENYPAAVRFQAALQKYGITQQQLERHLLWQAELVRFVDFRFRGPAAAAAPPSKVQSASRQRAGSAAEEASNDPQLDAWLKDSRSQTRIEFKKDAFQ